jgi:hypothetical protein
MKSSTKFNGLALNIAARAVHRNRMAGCPVPPGIKTACRVQESATKLKSKHG